MDGVLGLGWNVDDVPQTPDYNSEPIHNILAHDPDVKKQNKFYVLYVAE
jgi:hypothetical protein